MGHDIFKSGDLTRESLERLHAKLWERPYPGSNVSILRSTPIQPRDGMPLDDLIEWLEWRASETATENWAAHCCRLGSSKSRRIGELLRPDATLAAPHPLGNAVGLRPKRFPVADTQVQCALPASQPFLDRTAQQKGPPRFLRMARKSHTGTAVRQAV